MRSLAVFAAAVFLLSHAWGLLHVVRGGPANVGNFASSVEGLASLATAPSYRFAVWGDPEDGIEVFERCASLAQERGCDFALILGDIVHAARAEAYEYFLAEFAETRFRGPVFTVVGNHDVRGDDDHLFRGHFGPPDFRFTVGPDLFVLFDNANGVEAGTRDFLEETLRTDAPGARRVFLFAHCPLLDFPRGAPSAEPTPTRGYAAVRELLDRHRVDAVFAGHLHAYRRAVERGITHVVTGGVGGRLQEANAFPHYVEVEVGPDGVKDTVVPLGPSGRSELVEQAAERVLVRYAFYGLWSKPARYLLLLAPAALAALAWRWRARAAPIA